jgi:type II restriction/modification system DNA methylase subunit YeeA
MNLTAPNRAELEIPSVEDIYYINNLRITTESGLIDKEFKDNAELKTFLSKRLYGDNQKAFDCLGKVK